MAEPTPAEKASAIKGVGATMLVGGAVGIPLKLWLSAPAHFEPGQSRPDNTIAWVLAAALVVLGVIVLVVGVQMTPRSGAR